MFVEVAVNLPPVSGTFHYHIPSELEGIIQSGHLITATFGRRKVQGVVLALSDKAPVEETRPIEQLLDPDPVLTPAQLELARWMHLETKASLIECITLMIPPGLSQQADSIYQLLSNETERTSPTEKRLINLLSRRGPLRPPSLTLLKFTPIRCVLQGWHHPRIWRANECVRSVEVVAKQLLAEMRLLNV
jgi:primosomal protein N'